MSVPFYMDEHVQSAITEGLRNRDVDVLTAQDDGRDGAQDPELLDRASELGRVLFSRDSDLLAESARRQAIGEPFAGVNYAHQLAVSIGGCVHDLELIAGACASEDLANQVIYLPL